MPTYPPNATFTPRLALPRPGLDDVADGPDAFNDLTDVLDPIGVVFAQGTLGARPAPGTPGRLYWATDTKAIFYDDGAAWQAGAGSGSAGVALPILDVGTAGQIRAGRQLTVADFTNLGLSQPRGLWNLSDLSNLGSDGRALANKGAVGFAPGINGAATTAAQFTGSTSQALYIPDSGAADPYRISTGSWGCWFRTAKRGTTQDLVTKRTTPTPISYMLRVGSGNVMEVLYSGDGSSVATSAGVSDIADDRWHFAVASHDGSMLRVYVDGVLEAAISVSSPIFAAAGPLNIGAYGADGATAASEPHFGRVDEAFVTADVLSDDQVRLLYAAKIAHGLGVAPTDIRVNVHRRRKGAAFVVGDFTTQPLRLYNFTAGALTDTGANGAALVNAGTAPVSVAGADGTLGNAFAFGAVALAHLAATDAGLPSALAARTYGAWFKTASHSSSTGVVVGWGTVGTADTKVYVSNGAVLSNNGSDAITGPYANDGQWHYAVVVEDNAATDGVKRKLYLDGRMVVGSTTMIAVTLAGAARFRIGANVDGSLPFTGQIDGAFVCGYAMAQDEITRLYAKGGQDLGASPKNAGDHVERVDASSLLVVFDTLESQSTVDVGVAA